MKPEQLSPEWKNYAYNEYLSLQDEQNGFIDGAQHYQSKVVELIEAKIAELKYRSKKAERFETSVDLSKHAEVLQLLLTDLTNLKP